MMILKAKIIKIKKRVKLKELMLKQLIMTKEI